MKEVKINTEYIKLGQLLKFAAIIDSGACAKTFLEENDVFINGNLEKRRGKKIYSGDIVEVLNEKIIIKSSEE